MAPVKREDGIGGPLSSDSGRNATPTGAVASASTVGRYPSLVTHASSVDDDGFERVLSPAERKALRKKPLAAANVDPSSAITANKAALKNFDSLLSKFKSRLQKLGINPSLLPVTSATASTCEARVEDLNALVAELDSAIKAAPGGITRSLQFTTVEEVDARVRDATEHMRRLKTSRGKPSGPSAEEVEAAIRENEVYTAYLREQRGVVEGFQRMKAFQASLTQFKKAILDVIAHRAQVAQREAVIGQAASAAASRVARQQEYICGLLRKLKSDKGEEFDQSALTRTEVVVMATAHRFHPPYNYMRRIKEKFCVHIDPPQSCSSVVSAVHLVVHGENKDVEACIQYLKSLDFHSCQRVNSDFDRLKKAFGGISGLSQVEDSFSVLTFYYQGILDIIGSRDGVNLAVNYVNEKMAELDQKKEARVANQGASRAPATLAEHEARRVQLHYDYLICKALSTRFRPMIRTIEADMGISVSFDMSPKDPKGTVYVNVDSNYQSADTSAADCIKQAVKRLEELVASLGTAEVPGDFDEETLAFLFSEEPLRGLFASQDVCLLRYNGAPHVVGQKSALKSAVARVTAFLRHRHQKPKEIFVPMEKALLLSNSTLSAIEDWTGAVVMTRDSINGSVLVIAGDTGQQEECAKKVNEVLSTHVEHTLDLYPAHMAVLSDNKYRIIRDLEQQSQVRMILKKETNQLEFHGQKEKVDEAVNVMKAFTDNFVSLDQTKVDDITLTNDFYAWTRVPRRHIGAVIGKGGSTLRDIIDNSGLRNMFVNRSESVDEIVCFEGNKESVKRALSILDDILEFDGVNQKEAPVEDVVMGRYSSTHSVLRHNVPSTTRPAPRVRSPGGKPLVFDCRDNDDFPALGS
ncbi:PRE-binding protein, putative [Babesia caballi]|uniref:PRE-binding protein, putative n=1 Tax=Babesia caballi TaxID=5871 RepID=A0AAV4LV83_BABCB|nr:PRE-binding protein, putative [Babesia caballi]